MPRYQKKTQQSAKKTKQSAKKPVAPNGKGIDNIWKQFFYHATHNKSPHSNDSTKTLASKIKAINGQGAGMVRKIELLEKARIRDQVFAGMVQKWVVELKKLTAADHEAVRESS